MNQHLEVRGSENGEANTLREARNGAFAEETENKLDEVSLLKNGSYADLPTAKISELMKLKSLENSSTQSLFTVVNKVLDGSIERKNGDIPQCTAFLLKRVVQEIEQRVSTQAENFKKCPQQNNLFKIHKEMCKPRTRVLETLTSGISEENEVVMNQLQRIKIEKIEIEDKKQVEEQDIIRLMKEREYSNIQISVLNQELELARNTYDKQCLQLETQAKETKVELEKKLTDLEGLLTDSRNKVKELEVFSKSKTQRWRKKELSYKSFLDSQSGVLQTQKVYSEEFNHLGVKLKGLIDAAENYHNVLAENRKLYNEVQDLKGENGELVVANPLKQGKDSHRLFKFNKVFGPTATQGSVLDTQPLIRSVLDGYSVCIFAYGQTGSGKTYTMVCGQAKTLMFVQLNPDVESYSETISTLKFAERVSGVELGAARSNKEGRGVRDLMEQVALLKDTITKKDEEIGRLQLLKTSVNCERRDMSSPRYGSSSPRRHSLGIPQPRRSLSGGKISGLIEKSVSDKDNSSEYSDKHSEAVEACVTDGGQSISEAIESRLGSVEGHQNTTEDVELLGFGDADLEERLSDISDGELSMGTETDGSINSIVELTLFPETLKAPADSKEKRSLPSKLPRPPQKPGLKGSSRLSLPRGPTKVSSSSKKPSASGSSSTKSAKQRQ
ncbi:hypothetical protein C3L33_08550, partial [Rhododendron williamsianum]